MREAAEILAAPPVRAASVAEVVGRYRVDGGSTLLACDGAVASGVVQQVEQLSADATHLVVSAGGNNALEQSGVLINAVSHPASSAILTQLADIRDDFRREYRTMLDAIMDRNLPTTVCTIYDAIPGLDRFERLGLGLFNNVILREAIQTRVPVIDLRLICSDASDFSQSSPIEPSRLGGAKIAAVIRRVITSHDFHCDCRVFM